MKCGFVDNFTLNQRMHSRWKLSIKKLKMSLEYLQFFYRQFNLMNTGI